ncbi:MAG: hypothetical protein GY898_33920 [Proteobacteria bacterium]|nr:hypothetical protein [Pseudomonadota bacterium]
MKRLLLIAGVLGAAAVAFAQSSTEPTSDEQPTVENSTSGLPAVGLPTPLPDPPPGLVDVPDTPGGRALAHADTVEVIDALGVRTARTGTKDCATAPAVTMGLAMLHSEASQHLRTASALLVGIEDGASLEARVAELSGRVDHLGLLVEQARRRSRGCDAPAPSPAIFLDADADASVGGRVAVYAQAEKPSQVVWVDGTPAAVTRADGWTVVVVDAGERTLCAADPREAGCEPGFVVDARMGSAFDLRAEP